MWKITDKEDWLLRLINRGVDSRAIRAFNSACALAENTCRKYNRYLPYVFVDENDYLCELSFKNNGYLTSIDFIIISCGRYNECTDKKPVIIVDTRWDYYLYDDLS